MEAITPAVAPPQLIMDAPAQSTPQRKKATPKAAPKEEEHPKIVKPVRSLSPQEVGETRSYRFGKTTPEVKEMFIKFVRAVFNGGNAFNDPKEAAIAAGIKPGLAPVFISRLTELKGNTGLALAELREDPETGDKQYFPNYAMEYIISYATQEMSNVQKRVS